MTSALLTPTHIAILLVILLLLFGAKRVPETGRALGQGMREFKDAIAGRAELPDSQPDCWKKHKTKET
jgi:sec-independent protein translocase protein TatA